jgi:3-oxoacyl-[acyl-carrier protein] reductase
MACEGASVVVTDVNLENIEKVVNEIKEKGGTAIGFKADVTKRSEVRELMETAVKKYGQIHILVNNAIARRNRASFLEMTDEDWDVVLAVGLKGVFNCIQAVAGYMMEQRYGKIINISSGAGMGNSPPLNECNANYAATKAGVIQLTKTFARELGPYGINVNSIAPGTIITAESSLTKRSKEAGERHIAYSEKLAVLARTGTPEDIVNVAIFLASDESSFISGQVIAANGGRTDHM